jgi:prevent-host-death family protein
MLPNIVDGIDTLTNFKRDSAKHLNRLRETGEPLVLTVNGKAAVVLRDAESYQRLMEEFDRLQELALQRGLDDRSAGRTQPMRPALEELAQKLGIGQDEAGNKKGRGEKGA